MKTPMLLVAILGMLLYSTVATAAPIKSETPVLNDGTLIDFEGQSDGTLIDTQYPGLVFTQAPDPGRPQIDVDPFLFGYTASSGTAVLTGSTEGGYEFPTVAGLVVDFDTPVSSVQAFLSDTGPLGDYLVQAIGAGDTILETVTILQSEIGPPDGLYVGFQRPNADIVRVQFGPSDSSGDAFSIDDLQYSSAPPIPVPVNSLWTLLLLAGLLGAVAIRRLHA